MRIAIVHDWLTGMRGGEYCLQAFLALYPEADIFTLVHVPGSTSLQIDQHVTQASFLNKLPGVRKYYRALLPLFPAAARSLKIEGYDLVISISHAAAKNVQVPEGTTHICYCLSPMRYIWDQAQEYLGAATPVAQPLIRALRRWDKNSDQINQFVAISRFVAARIRAFYSRRSAVIHPPADTSWIKPIDVARQGEAFLCAGALVPYKRVDAVIHAFNRLRLPLWIAGKGPEEAKLRAIAGSTIHFFGRVSDSELAELYRNARALVFPATEDFGLIPVECMAAGRPVIALHNGASRETVYGYKPWDKSFNASLDPKQVSGVFIRPTSDRATETAESVRFFLEREASFQPQAAVARAAQFGVKDFFERWMNLPVVQAAHSRLQDKRFVGGASFIEARYLQRATPPLDRAETRQGAIGIAGQVSTLKGR